MNTFLLRKPNIIAQKNQQQNNKTTFVYKEMPYYFGSTINGWARTCFENPLTESELRDSDLVFFVDDIMDWMEKNYGEDGDCECETHPKSCRETYERFPPKPTDKTKIGKWLRNYMDLLNITETQIRDNIFEMIYDNINVENIENLFHSLEIEDQLEFRQYVSSDERFTSESDNYISDETIYSNISSDNESSNSDMPDLISDSDCDENEDDYEEEDDCENEDDYENEDDCENDDIVDSDYDDMPELEEVYTYDEFVNLYMENVVEV